MERIRIKDLPHKDRPYEKCLSLGPDSLSDTELLAVSKVFEELLEDVDIEM